MLRSEVTMRIIDIDPMIKSRSISEIVLDFGCKSSDRLFFNGYQAWTTSHEMPPTDTVPPLRPLLRVAGKPWGISKYGDDFFLGRSGKPGCFHGFTYMYRRSGDIFTLIASTDETNGYTIFYYDSMMRSLRIVKDAGFTSKYDPDVHIIMLEGTEDEVFDAWFEASGIKCRPAAPLAGYSSWYNRFDKITDETITADLEGCSTMLQPGDLFQIDDGWQKNVGDWEAHPDKFPRGMRASVEDIHDRGYLAGLWLAPFSAAISSDLVRNHPDWVLRHGGKPWYAGFNWGGFYGLDIDSPGLRDHLSGIFDRIFNDWGFDLVKLDFLYGAAPWPTVRGPYMGESRGGRMCRAMRYLREWCGDGLILGCGVPLGPAFGVVDYCRIGCDTALDWEGAPVMRQILEAPSTRNALGDIYYRRQLDGRAFLNDADVFFLRKDNVQLSDEVKLTHAHACAQYGSLFLMSDNMGEYDEEQRSQYRELRRIWKDKDWTNTDFLELI